MRSRKRARAAGRLKAFLAAKPSGDLPFSRFVEAAGEGAKLWEDILLPMQEEINAGTLEQFIRADRDARCEFPSFLEVPDELAGRRTTLERLEILYRFK